MVIAGETQAPDHWPSELRSVASVTAWSAIHARENLEAQKLAELHGALSTTMNEEKGRACPTPLESADLRRIRCYFCGAETLLRCDLCNVAICLDHSVTLAGGMADQFHESASDARRLTLMR